MNSKNVSRWLIVLGVAACGGGFAADTTDSVGPLPAQANYVVYPGEQAVAAFKIMYPGEGESQAAARLYVWDMDGRLVETLDQTVALPVPCCQQWGRSGVMCMRRFAPSPGIAFCAYPFPCMETD